MIIGPKDPATNNNITIIATLPDIGINSGDEGISNLYVVPADQEVIPIALILRVKTVSEFVSGGPFNISVGTNVDHNNIYTTNSTISLAENFGIADQAMTFYFSNIVNGGGDSEGIKVAVGGETIKFSLDTGQSATTLDCDVILLGIKLTY